ncbi:MAG: LysR family transcriptional regulator [Hyphomicrobiales bacterium]|nr:LysR family transcriptional regulator [Hyphomicrobiales bacterium]
MNLRQLQFAQTVAETRSFSKAAELCNATQPTLSNAIAQLEAEIGGKLFVRTTRKVGLTAFGEFILPHIRAVLDARTELVSAADAYQNTGHKLLRIGFSPLVDMRLLDRVLAPYRQENPNVDIFFKECLLDDLAQRLGEDTLDIAIVPQSGEKTSFERFAFYSDDLYYLPVSGERQRNGPIRICDLPPTPVILTGGGCGLNATLKALFDSQGVMMHPYPGQAVSYKAIEDWVDLGIGAAILPEAKLTVAREAAIPLQQNDGRPAAFAFEWIWPSVAAKSHTHAFIDYVRGRVPALVADKG